MIRKNALIIGASSGIGAELSKILSSGDYRVAITGRRLEQLEAMCSHDPDKLLAYRMDVCDTLSTLKTLEAIRSKMGSIDLVIISAGSGDINHDLQYRIEEETIQTNVIGFTFIAGWAFNLFVQQGQGHLVGISSIAGLAGNPLAPSYNASKAYQINYLQGLKQKALKLKLPVFVTDIRPGFVDTAMAKGEGLFWVSPVDKAARMIVKDVEKKKRTSYVSRRWRIVASILWALPESMLYLLMNKG